MGDIGQLFSSSNDKWKDADSMIFLKQTVEKVRSAGFKINHIDSVIILQQPNISSYIDSMRSNISERISVDKSQISIKATTTDYMGYIGKGEGIATGHLLRVQGFVGLFVQRDLLDGQPGSVPVAGEGARGWFI